MENQNSLNFKGLIEEVKNKTDIVQIIGQHISLNQHNKARCPFHDDKNPSFSVNPTGQYFYCFGCGVGGDVFEFLELYEKKTFMEVLTDLADEAGISVPDISEEHRELIKEERIIEDILTKTADFYHKNLTPEASTYLTQIRGFSDETISQFKIGYARGDLPQYLIEECKFPEGLCVKAGVVKKGEDGLLKKYYSHRVIFPNFKRGRVVHLSGRSIEQREPKYLHLPGEMCYLYNEDSLLNKEVYITEGIPDCLTLVQAGYPAVAILGVSNFREEYLKKFSRCERIYICLDRDIAGKEASLKIGNIIGDRARVIELPDGMDVNDYFKEHGKDDFNTLVATAKDIIKYELSLISPSIDKTELPERLEPILKKFATMNKAKIEAYLRHEIKPRFKLVKEDIEAYRDLINKHRKEETTSIRNNHSEVELPYTALFEGLIDIVEYEGESAFLIKEGEKLSILTCVEKKGILYAPPPKEMIPWLLPRGDEVLKIYEEQSGVSQKETDKALYNDLLDYHKSISELPGEEYYDLIVSWDIHTYLQESVDKSPVICLFAVPERGKSRTGKGIINVAYRGIHVECLREAYLFRAANNLGASVFFDVIDLWKKALRHGSQDIVLNRFEKGTRVARVLFPERGPHKDTVYFSIFGPTIIGTNEGVSEILETRAVVINMPNTVKIFEESVTPQLGLPFKERLLAFRARHLGETLPRILKPAHSRLGDILKPLLQIILLVNPDREPYFNDLIDKLKKERLIERIDSIEAQILKTITDLNYRVERGVLPIKLITDTFNEDKQERYQVTYQRIGRRLAAMGFRKGRTNTGASAIICDKEGLERLKVSYGLDKTTET